MIQAVFVHLGNTKAPWLKKNVIRHQTLFPKVPSVVVSDNTKLLREFEGVSQSVFHYSPGGDTTDLLESTTHNKEFRQNVWRISLERLFELEAFH
jgi:hypothetical protein